MIEITVTKNRNSDKKIIISRECRAIRHDQLTRIQIKIGTTLVDSNINPELFDTSNSDYILVKLGQANIAAGQYSAKLAIFDSVHTLGIPIDDAITITFQDF